MAKSQTVSSHRCPSSIKPTINTHDMELNGTKELPYGIQDFVTIAEQNIYYVDKTMYIPKLEDQARNLFFIRPRRFGKSVFLSMLHA